MRHNKPRLRLSRNRSKRNALLENLVSSLLRYQQIQTTLPKAKAAKRLADRVIHLGKSDTLASRRRVFGYLQDHELTSRLFREVAPRFKSRQGGYTRVYQLNRRKGDGAQMALLELTEKEVKVKEAKGKTKKEAKAAPPSKEKAPEARAEKTEKKASSEELHLPKHPAARVEKPKGGFLKNLGKFFRRKGFGNKGA